PACRIRAGRHRTRISRPARAGDGGVVDAMHAWPVVFVERLVLACPWAAIIRQSAIRNGRGCCKRRTGTGKQSERGSGEKRANPGGKRHGGLFVGPTLNAQALTMFQAFASAWQNVRAPCGGPPSFAVAKKPVRARQRN